MRTAFPRRPGDTLCLTLFKSGGQGLALSESAPPERRGGLWVVETEPRARRRGCCAGASSLSRQPDLSRWVKDTRSGREPQPSELKLGQRWKLRSPLLQKERDPYHSVCPGASSATVWLSGISTIPGQLSSLFM